MQWIHDEDRNTVTYHLATIIRRRTNKILKFRNEAGEWLNSLILIKKHILKIFDQGFFTTHTQVNFKSYKPTFWNMLLKENDKNGLIGMPSKKEIFQALKNQKPTKAPSLDGAI